jgi:hypothetical protein
MSCPLLYVVARDQPEVYERLKRQTADGGIEVVLDRRRQRDRRREPRSVADERRGGERRLTDIREELARSGWVIVCLWNSATPGRRPDCLGPGDRVILRRYNPMLPQRLVGRSGRLIDVRRIRAEVHFDGEAKPRRVDLTDLAPLGEAADAPVAASDGAGGSAPVSNGHPPDGREAGPRGEPGTAARPTSRAAR